jgi:predicted GNAT superfamily acetyltransferase
MTEYLRRKLYEKVLDKLQIYFNPLGLDCHIALEKDIETLQQHDNIVFGIHQSISNTELSSIIKNGLILIVTNKAGQIVGQSQVLLNTSNILKSPINSYQAFAYGTGILKEYQGRGIGHTLRMGQILVANESNKSQILATCRIENYYSLKSLHKLGYYGYMLYENYYGKMEDGGGRVALKKLINNDVLTTNDVISVPIKFEEEVNVNIYKQIKELFSHSFVLFNVKCNDNNLQKGSLVFKKLRST